MLKLSAGLLALTLAFNAVMYQLTPALCEFPHGRFQTYLIEQARGPGETAWQHLADTRCFGEVKAGGEFDWAEPVAVKMREVAYDSFVRARMTMSIALSAVFAVLVLMLADAWRRKKRERQVLLQVRAEKDTHNRTKHNDFS